MNFYLKLLFKVSRSVSGCTSVSSSDKNQNDSRAQYFKQSTTCARVSVIVICVWGATEPDLPLFSLQLIHFLPSSSWVVCVCMCICQSGKAHEITGGHTVLPSRGGCPLRPSCHCKPPCGYQMTSSGWRHNLAGRPPPCLHWWWVALTVRAACLPAPSQGKQFSKYSFNRQLHWDFYPFSGVRRLWGHECTATRRERARRGAVSGRNSLPASARKTSVTEFKYFHIHHKKESNRWMEVWMKLISSPPSLKQRQQTNRSYFLFRPKPDYVTDSEDIVEKIIWENMHLGFLPTNRTHINCFPPKKNSSPTCEHVTGQTANSLLSCLKIMYIFQVKAAVVQSKVCCGLSPSTLLPIFPFFLACFKAANKRANLFTASVCCHHWCPLRGLMGKSDLNNIFELNCKWLADLSLFGI